MILTNLAHSDGVASFAIQMYRNMDHERFSVDFLVHDRIDEDYASLVSENNDHVFSVGSLSMKRYPQLKKSFHRILQENSYDVVHCNLPNMAWLYLKLAQKEKVRMRIVHVHQTSYAETKSHAIRNKILFKIGRKYSNLNLACSEMAGKFYFGEESFTTIYNGIDYERFSFNEERRRRIRKELKIDEDEVLFGQVGRYSIVKNQSFTLSLFHGRKEKVVLIGSGTKEEYFKSLEKEKGQNIMLLDVKSNVEDYYCAMDYLLLPSLYEGLPIVALEAQATGLTCIMADTITKECDFGNGMYLPLEMENWKQGLPDSIPTNRKSLYDSRFDGKIQAERLEQIYSGK